MGARWWVASVAVVVAVTATVAVHAVSDHLVVDTVSYLGILVAASIGAWVGVERAPRAVRLVPRLIATGVSLSALGDLVWTFLDLRGPSAEVSVADPFWLTSYVALGGALWLASLRATPDRKVRRSLDIDFAIDVATIVAVGVTILWITSLDAIVDDRSLSVLVRAVLLAYPLADAVLLALVLRLLMSVGGRAVIEASFAVGVCLWLAADLGYLLVPGAGSSRLALDTAWMVAPVLLARSAWRVSKITPSPRSSLQGGSAGQLLLAVGPLVVPPALELAAHLRGDTDQPFRLLVGTMVMVVLALVRIWRLIRAHERASRELEVARDQAVAASRAKSVFVANMSHEIRTPLTSVLASSEMLEETCLDEFQHQLIEKMQRSGKVLRSLVEDVLDFSRIEAGQIELASTTFDIATLVADLDDLYSSRACAGGIGFSSSIDPRTPSLVAGDPGRLLQVLTNLLDNALKFTHEGRVELRVHPLPEARDPERAGLEFLVSDTGIGISQEDQETVFQSFTQVDGSTTRRYGGTGLGLAIAKELVELMGGSLTLSSQLGRGSVFAVRLVLPPLEARPGHESATHAPIEVSA